MARRTAAQQRDQHPAHRTARLWTGVLCAAAIGSVAACSAGPAEPDQPARVETSAPAPGSSAPADPGPSESRTTAPGPSAPSDPPQGTSGGATQDPSFAEEVVEPAGLSRHLEALQGAADRNGGTRVDGSSGFEASAVYVEEQLRAAGYEPRRQGFSYGRRDRVDSFNVLADAGGGSGGVLVLGAHLDSVEEGPGLNDNGSGVAAVLEVALRLAEEGAVPRERIRFAFWGGEEDGMHGSEHYVEELSRAEANAHTAYLNMDVVGSPNAVVFVYDGDGSDSEDAGPEGSAAVERVLVDILRADGVEALPFGFIGDSDYDAFVRGGIPTGGLFTGDAGTKSAAEVRMFGGRAGEQYDECYHEACDTIGNVDMAVLEQMTEALLSATVSLGGIEDALADGESAQEGAG